MRPETPLLLAAAAFVLVARCRKPVDWLKLARAGLLMGAGPAPAPAALGRSQLAHASRNSIFSAALRRVAGRNCTCRLRFLDPHVALAFQRRLSNSMESGRRKNPCRQSAAKRVRLLAGTRSRRQSARRVQWHAYVFVWMKIAPSARSPRERTARFPLRTFLKIPLLRSVAMWFTPRMELLPYSGQIWPLRSEWRDDRQDLLATLRPILRELPLRCSGPGRALGSRADILAVRS